jgi:hypothetical protein
MKRSVKRLTSFKKEHRFLFNKYEIDISLSILTEIINQRIWWVTQVQHMGEIRNV